MKKIQEFDTVYLSPDARHRRNKKRNIAIALLVLLSLSACLGAYLGFYLNKDTSKGVVANNIHPVKIECPEISDDKKFDCYPDAPVTESECLNRGCCYSAPKNISLSSSLPPLNVPYCYYPSKYTSYVVGNVVQTKRRIRAKLRNVKYSGFPKDIPHLNLLISFIDDNTLRMKVRIFK